MDKDIKVSLQMAQIEILYAEAELANFGPLWPELRKTLEHIAAARVLMGDIAAQMGIPQAMAEDLGALKALAAPSATDSARLISAAE